MAKKLPTIWPLEPHTAAKHAILKKYLEAWVPILSRYGSRIVYIDACAGPGEYTGGEPGSPIIALAAASDASAQRPLTMTFLFVEPDEARAEHLKQKVGGLALPPTFSVDVEVGTAVETISPLLDALAAERLHLAPTFAFLDPFGFSQVPMSLVSRLMSNERCEVLITFMFEEINRFVSHPEMEAHFDALFGGPEWRRALALPAGPERRVFIRECYRLQLTGVAGVKFVRSFEMRNDRDAIDYFMFFGTNHVLGLEKMKEAMWRVDPTGAFQFSDATDPAQLTLLGGGPDSVQIRALLRTRFTGQTAKVEAVKAFIIEETPFCGSHYKSVLKAMEYATPPELRVTEAPLKRKRGTFPDGVVIEFL